MGLLAPVWFEELVAVLLLLRVGLEWVLRRGGGPDLADRVHPPLQYLVLLAGGVVLVGLLRSDHLGIAAILLTVLIVIDTVAAVVRSEGASNHGGNAV